MIYIIRLIILIKYTIYTIFDFYECKLGEHI